MRTTTTGHTITVDLGRMAVLITGDLATVPRDEVDAACREADVWCDYVPVDGGWRVHVGSLRQGSVIQGTAYFRKIPGKPALIERIKIVPPPADDGSRPQ